MEWNVKNAVSRDVERQHLNKILKEIREAVDKARSGTITQEQVRQVVTTVVQGGGGGSQPARPVTFTITLDGDVSGQGQVRNGSDVVITTTVDPSILGIPEAPIDSNVYWRTGGVWMPVPGVLTSLSFVEGDGFLHYSDEGGWDVKTPEETSAAIHTLKLEAGETIHGRRAVAADLSTVYHPSLSAPEDAPRIIGIAKQAGTTGGVVEVQTGGTITEPGWTWAAGPVYVDDEGVLTQTAPSTGWVVCVGKAIASDTIDINILLSLIRS